MEQKKKGGKRPGAGRKRKYDESIVISLRVEKRYINQVKMQVMITLAKLRKRDNDRIINVH